MCYFDFSQRKREVYGYQIKITGHRAKSKGSQIIKHVFTLSLFAYGHDNLEQVSGSVSLLQGK